jgi:hypothetical protein
MADDIRESGNPSASRRRLTPAQRAAAAADAAARARSEIEGLDGKTPISLEGSNRAPPATTDVLRDFGKVVLRSRDPEIEEIKRRKLELYKQRIQQQRPTLNRLIKWADADVQTAKDWVLFALRFFRRPPLPKDYELISLARHFFPPRMALRVHVCDFGDNRFSHSEVSLGEIERCMKP